MINTIKRKCRECGCTDAHACIGGCFWVGWDLCSSCYTLLREYANELKKQNNHNDQNKVPTISEELITLLKMDGINSKQLAIEILENLKEYEV